MTPCDATRDVLERTLGGTLSAAPAAVGEALLREAEQHLAGCAACAAEAAAWRDVAARVEHALTPPSAGLPDALLAERVAAALPAGRVRRLPLRAAVAAAVLVAAGLAAWRLGSGAGLGDGAAEQVASARPYPLQPPAVPDYAGPRFTDVSESAGVTNVDHTGVGGAKDWMVEVVGHGAAVLDMDGDGDLDLFVPDGNRVEPDARVENTWRLYRNDGDMRFTDVTAGSGLQTAAWAGGAVAGDLNGDGASDLFVPCFGANHLYLGRGDGTFEDASERAGIRGRDEEWSTAAALGDLDGDGDLDIYVSNYADMRRFIVESGVGRGCRWRDMAVPCGPQPMRPQRDRLYLNRGDGTFVDATEERLPNLARYAFQPLITDFDGDGDLDIFVAADGHPNLLFLNDGTGHFSEQGRAAGVAVDVDAREQACMGAASGDIDGDGLPDLFVTNFSHEPNVLYRARPGVPGRPLFVDVTRGAALDEPSFFTLGWGVSLADLDCDGDLDALSANGHLYPDVAENVPSTSYEQHLAVFENAGRGRFREVTAAAGDGVLTPRVHRGLLVADFDDDGAPDIFTTVLNGRAALLRSDGRGVGASVRLILRRSDGRTEAAGARARAGGRRADRARPAARVVVRLVRGSAAPRRDRRRERSRRARALASAPRARHRRRVVRHPRGRRHLRPRRRLRPRAPRALTRPRAVARRYRVCCLRQGMQYTGRTPSGSKGTSVFSPHAEHTVVCIVAGGRGGAARAAGSPVVRGSCGPLPGVLS